jgi:hypothetical protein
MVVAQTLNTCTYFIILGVLIISIRRITLVTRDTVFKPNLLMCWVNIICYLLNIVNLFLLQYSFYVSDVHSFAYTITTLVFAVMVAANQIVMCYILH